MLRIEAYSIEDRKNHVKHQKDIFGKTSENLMNLFSGLDKELKYQLRKAEPKDEELYLNWANDPEVRKQAFSTSLISAPEHHDWFTKRINKSHYVMLILVEDNKEIGQIRFDKSGRNYILSYSVESKYRGAGVGKVLVKKGLEYLNHYDNSNKTVLASVKLGNYASDKVFLESSFRVVNKTNKAITYIKQGH